MAGLPNIAARVAGCQLSVVGQSRCLLAAANDQQPATGNHSRFREM